MLPSGQTLSYAQLCKPLGNGMGGAFPAFADITQ